MHPPGIRLDGDRFTRDPREPRPRALGGFRQRVLDIFAVQASRQEGRVQARAGLEPQVGLRDPLGQPLHGLDKVGLERQCTLNANESLIDSALVLEGQAEIKVRIGVVWMSVFPAAGRRRARKTAALIQATAG